MAVWTTRASNGGRRDPIHDDITVTGHVNLEDLDTVTYLPAPELLVRAGARPLEREEEESPVGFDDDSTSEDDASPSARKSGIVARPTFGAVTTTASVWPLAAASNELDIETDTHGETARMIAEMAREHAETAAAVGEAERSLAALSANPTHAVLVADALDWFSLLDALRIELDAAFVALRDPRLMPLAGPRTNLGTYLRGLVVASGSTTRAVARAATSLATAVDMTPICENARDVASFCFIELVPFILGELDALSPTVARASAGATLSRLREAVERSSWHGTALRAAAQRG